MRLTVNLASRPFVELRPFFLRLRIVMAVLALVGLGAAVAAHVQQRKLDRAQLQLDQLRHQSISAQQSKLHSEARMRQPGNAEVLDRAHFLNALFLSKSFSWTAVMMDLETVLPSGVQVTSIEPQVAASGDVIIRLRVAGDRDRAVQLVRNLEHSRRFLAPRLSGESAQAREPGQGVGAASAFNGNPSNAAGTFSSGTTGGGLAPAGVEFELLADYSPLPLAEDTVALPTVSPTRHRSLVAPAAAAARNPAASRRSPR